MRYLILINQNPHVFDGMTEEQLQAASAAVHAEAPGAEDTDSPQILGLYEPLHRSSPGR